MTTLRDDLLPTADALRGQYSAFGIARYTVTLRRLTWSGGRPGLGTTTQQNLAIVTIDGGSPLVTQVKAQEVASSGGTFSLGDFRVIEITPGYAAITGNVVQTGSASGTVVPSTSVPAGGVSIGTWGMVVKIMLGGNVGVATFQISTDGGSTWSTTQTTAASVPVPAQGLVLAFAGSFTATETYAFNSVSGGFTKTQLRQVRASDAEELFWVMVGDEGEVHCTLIDADFSNPVDYRLTLRRRRDTP